MPVRPGVNRGLPVLSDKGTSRITKINGDGADELKGYERNTREINVKKFLKN